ncbi:MAG: AAA family ATPase [Thiogranum sp.]|nr:AAA family ATPase [Thiogranum sp.]
MELQGVPDREATDAGETLVAALLDPAIYDHPTADIHSVETHGAWVILTGPFAYKLKKPVNFGFLDYSTLEKRRINCQEELRLNRRFAPQLYLDVIAITGSPARPRLGGGSGPVIEYAVRMRQFPEQGLLSSLAEAEQLNDELIEQIVDEVASFHQSTEVAPVESRFGEPDQVARWVIENFTHIRAVIDSPAELADLERLRDWVEAERQRLDAVLWERKQGGYIRECHGDLHLGNMTLVDGRVTLFDCIEFNPELRWIDVMSEAAFLLMDLDARQMHGYANHFLNGYLQRTGDYRGLQVLRWYRVYRALVRAKVAALRAQQQNVEANDAARRDYAEHLRLAHRYTLTKSPVLLLMHGLSGSGKTTVARWLCAETGMIQLRSDIERKRLYGLAPLQREGAGLKNGLYSASHTERTYARLLELAQEILDAGYSVVVDAAFLKHAQRDRFRRFAARQALPWLVLNCDAPDQALQKRIEARRRLDRDASDATLDVLALQRTESDDFTAEEDPHVVRLETGSRRYRESLLDRLSARLKN